MNGIHHPVTRAALNLPGLCPVCGGAASRKVTYEVAGARETYRCAIDGDSEYLHGAEVGIRVAGQDAATPVPAHHGFTPLGQLAGAQA